MVKFFISTLLCDFCETNVFLALLKQVFFFQWFINQEQMKFSTYFIILSYISLL